MSFTGTAHVPRMFYVTCWSCWAPWWTHREDPAEFATVTMPESVRCFLCALLAYTHPNSPDSQKVLDRQLFQASPIVDYLQLCFIFSFSWFARICCFLSCFLCSLVLCLKFLVETCSKPLWSLYSLLKDVYILQNLCRTNESTYSKPCKCICKTCQSMHRIYRNTKVMEACIKKLVTPYVSIYKPVKSL